MLRVKLNLFALPKITTFGDRLQPATDLKVCSLSACILIIFGVFCSVVPDNVSKLKIYSRLGGKPRQREILSARDY